MQKQIVAYCRVSTKRQGESGLGLEAQRSAVEQFAGATSSTLIGTYVEIESGKRSDRPELARALAHAKRSGARLVVAKLDRLARNVAFTAQLLESDIAFTACDYPDANKLTLQILAAVAEDEARRISDRTKAALKAAKERGVKLGSNREGHWEGREDLRLAGLAKAREKSIEVRRRAAETGYSDVIGTMQELRASGLSLRKIAERLNEEEHTTRRGKPWNPMQVRNVLKRAAKQE